MEAVKIAYLKTIEKFGIDPNFFVSKTYLDQPRFTGEETRNYIMIKDEDGVNFLPPINKHDGSLDNTYVRTTFPGQAATEFFDYQYLYDPKAFQNMKGGGWQTFRKNSKKFLKKYPNAAYRRTCDKFQVEFLLANWLDRKSDYVHDYEFMIEVILNPRPLDYVRYLMDDNGLMRGLVYADSNYRYTNFRYLLTDGTSWVDEFLRLKFYTCPVILNSGRLVNDGGCLGSPGLEKFKDKLNPIKKQKIYCTD